jgi:uncharacterized membrane protein
MENFSAKILEIVSSFAVSATVAMLTLLWLVLLMQSIQNISREDTKQSKDL